MASDASTSSCSSSPGHSTYENAEEGEQNIPVVSSGGTMPYLFELYTSSSSEELSSDGEQQYLFFYFTNIQIFTQRKPANVIKDVIIRSCVKTQIQVNIGKCSNATNAIKTYNNKSFIIYTIG